MSALIAGERSPAALAQLARSSMRRKIPALQEALTGRFTEHHAFLAGKMLTWVDAIDADIAELDARIGAMIAPFAQTAERLDEIPGIGAGFYGQRIHPDRKKRARIRQLEALGYKATLEPAA
jgi:transposase